MFRLFINFTCSSETDLGRMDSRADLPGQGQHEARLSTAPSTDKMTLDDIVWSDPEDDASSEDNNGT
jgi:hypothetical protein